MRLRYAVLFVKDPERMERFYRHEVGVTECLYLHPIPAEIAVGIEIAEDEIREETPLKLVFESPDAEAVVARLAASGVRVMKREWGAVWDVVDPEGNMLQIAAPVVEEGGR